MSLCAADSPQGLAGRPRASQTFEHGRAASSFCRDGSTGSHQASMRTPRSLPPAAGWSASWRPKPVEHEMSGAPLTRFRLLHALPGGQPTDGSRRTEGSDLNPFVTDGVRGGRESHLPHVRGTP